MADGVELRAAAERVDLQQVTKLLERGADVSVADKDGCTALHFAARDGHVAVTEKLPQLGADASSQKQDSWTALHLAAWNGHLAVLERHAQVNRPDDDGWTALILAAENGHSAVVNALLARGANVNSTNKYGSTSMHRAAENGHVAVVKSLLAHGADINGRAQNGNTALHWAALSGHVAVVEALVARGAEVNAADEEFGNTALHLAAEKGHAAVVETLLARGAEVNVADDEMGSTALHLAAEKGHVAVVEALLTRGADVDRANSVGNTPLLPAASSNESVALALWCAGADPLLQNNFNQTPLSLLPEDSDAARQMRAGLSNEPAESAPSTDSAAADHHQEPPPLTQLQKVWLLAKTSAITPQQLLDALQAVHITSFSDFVLAHHLLLLAVRQRVLTRSQLLAFGGSRDYLLENVYLPVTKFALSDEQKFWLSGLLSYAEKRKFFRDGNAVLVKIVADLRSEIRQTRLEMHSALVSVAREINSLHDRVTALEHWTDDAAKNFEALCEGQQQMLSDMNNMAASLQQLHSLLQQQQRNQTIAGVLGFCLAMIPVVEGALAGATFAAQEIAFGFTVEHALSGANSAVNEILAVDISNFQTVSVLTSDEYISKLDPVARKRVEAVVEQTDFQTLPNLQQRLSVVVEELKDDNDFNESVKEEGDGELRQRFSVLASRSLTGEQSIPGQDAISELQHMLQLLVSQAGANVKVEEDDVEDVVLENMDHAGLIDLDAFIKSFNELREKYPAARRQREPAEIRERFQKASGAKNVLKIRFAKRMLRILFDESGSEASSSRAPLSFTRTNNEWNDADVDALLAADGADGKSIDEEGFVRVSMKVLFAQ